MENQKFNEYRVNSLPTSGLSAGDRYYLSVGGGKYKTFIVSDSGILTGDAGAEFLEKDTMAQMRAISSREIWAIQNGYYKGVRLNGYYVKGDTPTPIDYFISDTTDEEDGGSVVQANGIKLEHSFYDSNLHDSYFGFRVGNTFSNEENVSKLNRMYSLGADQVIHTKGITANVNDTVLVTSGNTRIVGNGFVIRQADQSGMIVTGQGHLKHLFHIKADNVIVDGLYFDDNLDNNFVTVDNDGVVREVHFSIAGAFPGATRVGHDCVVIEAHNVTVKNCTVNGSSWTGIKAQRNQETLERINNTVIENNVIYNSARDAISLLHTVSSVTRGNKVYGSTHHAIHAYINTFNTKIYDNYIFNDLDELYPWFTGINNDSFDRAGIVGDHGAYPNKTVSTEIFNNVIEGAQMNGTRTGISFAGFPEDISIYNNTIKFTNTGISHARGNAIGKGAEILNNNIVSSNTGIAIWLADGGSGWQGGMTGPQDSKIVVSGNTIEASVAAFRTSGTQSAIDEWYNSYHLSIQNNTIVGSPEVVFDQQINFSSGDTGKDFKIIYKNNSEPLNSVNVSAQAIVNSVRGNAEVVLDTYYPVDLNKAEGQIRNAVAGGFYKIMDVNMTGARQVRGVIKLYDMRATINNAEIEINLVGANMRSLYQRSSAEGTNTSVDNFLNTNNVILVRDATSGTNYSLYIRTGNANRDFRIDFSGLELNEYVTTSSINFYKTPQSEASLPEGPNITSENAVKKVYNQSRSVELVASSNGVSDGNSTAVDVAEVVADLNDLISKYNDLVILTNELKGKLNETISTEVESGQRWP